MADVQTNAAAVRSAMHARSLDIKTIVIRAGSGLGGSAVRRALRGRPLHLEHAERLADVLGVPVASITGGP